VPRARSPLGVFHGRPHSTSRQPARLSDLFFFWKAVSLITLCREGPYWPEGRHRARERLSDRGPPQPRPRALGSRRYSEGLGLSVVGGANRGETLPRAGAAPRGGGGFPVGWPAAASPDWDRAGERRRVVLQEAKRPRAIGRGNCAIRRLLRINLNAAVASVSA
jgi:hypothetical protein